MVQIWRVPPRVDSKTMWRPSGAQLGRSLRPESRVISTMLAGGGVHDVDVVIAVGTAPTEGEHLSVGRPGGIDDVAHVGQIEFGGVGAVGSSS